MNLQNFNEDYTPYPPFHVSCELNLILPVRKSIPEPRSKYSLSFELLFLLWLIVN